MVWQENLQFSPSEDDPILFVLKVYNLKLRVQRRERNAIV